MKNFLQLLLPILLLFLSNSHATAYNLRQYSCKNGLSNSAILSMYQQENGLLWIGSCDGLNTFDGINLKTYPSANSTNNLSGNMIDQILETGESVLWIQTNYGLDRLDTKTQTIEHFKEFKNARILTKSYENDIYLINEDDYIHYYHSDTHTFGKVHIPGLYFEKTLQYTVDANNLLWIFSSDGLCRTFSILRTEKDIQLAEQIEPESPQSIRWCFIENTTLYYIDQTYAFYEYDLLAKKKNYIYDLTSEINERGEISAIIKKTGRLFHWIQK